MRKSMLFAGGGLLLVLAAAVGTWGWSQARREPAPAITVLHIGTRAPGLDVLQVESQVTVPLEQQAREVPGLAVVESTSVEGASSLVLELAPGANPETTLDDVRTRVARGLRLLPSEAEPPLVGSRQPFSDGWVWVPFDGDDAEALAKESARIYAALELVPGVSEVDACGAPDIRLVVSLDPQKLTARKLAPETLFRKLQRADGALVQVGARSRPADPVQVSETTVADGVKVADVASVSVETARPCVAVRAGRKGMLFAVRLAGRSQRRARTAGGDELRQRLEQSQVVGDVLGFDKPAVRIELEPGRPLPAAELEQLAQPEAAGVVVESHADGGHAAVVWFAPGVEPARGARAIATRLAPRVGAHVRGGDLEDVAAYLRLEGEDLPTLASAAKRAADVARAEGGVLAAWTEGTAMDDHQTLEVDGESAARHGTSRSELALLVRMLGPNGAEVDHVTLRGAPATLTLRVPGDFRGLVLPAASGAIVPLADVLRAELRSTPLQVVRRDGKRTAFVWVITRDPDRVRVLDELRGKIPAALPAGVLLAR